MSDKGGKDANGATYISVPSPRRLWHRALPKTVAKFAKSRKKQSGQQLHIFTATYRLENGRNFFEHVQHSIKTHQFDPI